VIRISPGEVFDADVIVVGGGPGGSAAAFHLVDAGLDVLVIDRATFPRDKVCGDFVGPVGLAELDAMGVTGHLDERHGNRVSEAAVFVDGHHVLTRSLPQLTGFRDYGIVIPREQLDQYVIDAAISRGARLWQGTTFNAYRADEHGIDVDITTARGKSSLRTRLLIGADGSNSAVARQHRGGPLPSSHRIMAVRAYFQGVVGPQGRADLLFHEQTFPGYTWLFPTGPSTANVGVGMVSDVFPRNDEHLRPLLLRLVNSDAALMNRLSGGRLDGRVKGFPLATYNPAAPLIGRRLLLAGDAAGLINPINGEGIQYALLSGRWAAETAIAAEASDFDRASLAVYKTRIRSELGADLALAGLIVQIISNRDLKSAWMRVLDMVLNSARADSEYAELAGGILAGLQPTTTALGKNMLSRLAHEAITEALEIPGLVEQRKLDVTASFALALARVGFQSAHDAVTDPVRFRQWVHGVARSGGAVGAELARHAVVRNRGHSSRSTM